MNVLVVGAKDGSLGDAVWKEFRIRRNVEVMPAGISGEGINLNITDCDAVREFFAQSTVHHIVCTAGVNMPGTIQGQGWLNSMKTQAIVNYFGPMILLSEWCRSWRDRISGGWMEGRSEEGLPFHFVAVSSNSAHVARSQSGGYCASKAALSMGIRCAAREQASGPFSIWCVEPGWLNGTPMSQQVTARLKGEQKHRIPHGTGINRNDVARFIVDGVIKHGKELNGGCFRLDGGEQ